MLILTMKNGAIILLPVGRKFINSRNNLSFCFQICCRVIEFAFRELELYAVKAARTVLRGLGGSNVARLPDVVVKGVHYLACLGVFAFFCKYHDRKKRMKPSDTACV